MTDDKSTRLGTRRLVGRDMRKLVAAALLVVIALASTGCFGFDYGDPGPLEVEVVHFRTFIDRWHVEYEIHFTNIGTKPITYIHAGVAGGSMYDGGNFKIEGRDYVAASNRTTKVWVDLFVDEEGNNPGYRPDVLVRDEPLLPGRTVNATYRLFHKHQTGSYGDWGHVANDTDFYTLTFVVKYSDGSYEWVVDHNLPCYNALGEQIHWWAGDRPGEDLNCPTAIGPRDAPKWERHVPTAWNT